MLLLGATNGGTAVELIAGDEKLPLPVGLDDAYAFDHALAREGWVVVLVGYQAAGLRDGDLLHPVRLPDAWRVAPAGDPRLAVLQDSGGGRKPASFRLVDCDGVVHREVEAQAWNVVGELASGHLAVQEGLLAWDGTLVAPPVRGRPAAVLGGRHLVLEGRNTVELVDMTGGTRRSCELGGADLLSGAYNVAATAVAFAHDDEPAVLVVTPEEGPRWLDCGTEPSDVLWLDDHRLLLVRGHRVLDVRTGALDAMPRPGRQAWPRLVVTGRFDPEQLRAALRPAWTVPLARDVRAQLIAAAEARLPADERAVAEPAIRLRSCLPPKRIAVGASRLGGRPDLPRGHGWPRAGGRPLAFFAQLSLAELSAALPEAELPADGLLLVFGDIEDDFDWPEAVHVEVVPTESLRRAPWPADLRDDLRYAPALAVAEPTLATRAPAPAPDHRVLGPFSAIQAGDAPEGHELLMQIDGDSLTGWSFADGGRLHIWRPRGAPWTGVVEGCEVDLDSA